MSFDADAPEESCTCPKCRSYRPCYPFTPEDPCLECRERAMKVAPELLEFVTEIAHDGFSATHDGCDARPCLHCRAARLMCKAEGREP